MSARQEWSSRAVKNVLLDINGVLFESGEDQAIAGSVDAMKKFCLVTNECTTAKLLLAEKLNRLGYNFIQPSNIISPAPVACQYLIDNNLRPRLHIWDGVLDDFKPALENWSEGGQANCIVVGDVMDKLSRDFIDESLEIMLKNREQSYIVSLGAGRYYKDSGRLRMDTGAYVAAFEYCLGVKAVNVGKPSGEFFSKALEIVGGKPEDTIMIGDDIVSDVGGAQALGMRGFLVRTGKYKPSDETKQDVRADDVFDNLEEAVDRILSIKTNN